MALQKLQLKPGVNKEGTNYSNEDGFYYSEKVRFRSGYAEKIGGWSNIGSYTYYGIARSMWAWVSLTSESLLGLGTTQKFYISYGTKYYDITPLQSTGYLSSPYISTTAGSLIGTIYAVNHGITPGTFVTISKATDTLSSAITAASSSIPLTIISGFPTTGSVQIDQEIITYTGISGSSLTGCSRGANNTTPAAHLASALVVSLAPITVGGINFAGQQQVANVLDSNSFIIIASTPATSTATGGTGSEILYDFAAGTSSFNTSAGWGATVWGGVTGDPTTGWGRGVVLSNTPSIRLWSQVNYDQDLVFAARYGSIYWWTKNTSAFPRAVTLNTYSSTQTKTTTTASWANGASTITVADSFNINTGATVRELVSGIPVENVGFDAGTYVSTSYGFGTTVALNQATISIASTTTATALSNSGTLPQSLTLASITNYQDSGVIQIGSEQILYSGINIATKTLTIAARGYNSTTIVSHGVGSAVTYISSENVPVAFSYAGKHVPVKTLIVATSSSNAFTIAFGATPYNPYKFSTDADFDPLLVRWSDQDNPSEWVPETTNQSGEFRLSNGSKIIAANNSRQEILIWTDTAIYSMQYLGPPYVYGINMLMDNLSIASQNAVITVNNVTYWMGVDRFYQYSGRVETLPCSLRQFIFGRLNRNQLEQVIVGSNEGFNEIWWFYPSTDGNKNDSYVIFNHLENTWAYGTLDRTAWLDTQLEQYPLGAFSTERTYITTANLAETVFVGGTGGVASTTITVSAVLSDSIAIGQQISGTGINPGTYITAGAGLSWTINKNATVANGTTITAIATRAVFVGGTNGLSTTTLGFTSTTSGTVELGQQLSGVGITPGTYVVAIDLIFSNITTSAPVTVTNGSTITATACITATQTSIFVNDPSSFPTTGTVTIDSEQITYADIDYTNKLLTGCIRGANGTTPTAHITYSMVTFKTPNQIMFHENGYDDLSNTTPLPIEAYIESSDFDIGDGMNFAYVWRIIPDLSFTGSTVANPQCQLTVKVRQNPGAAYTVGSTDTQTVTRTATYPVEQFTGQVYTRVRGRQMAFRMASTGLGVFWQMGLMRIDTRQDGRR
jgi:hypothetical protein